MSAEIVSLSARRKTALPPALAQVEAYWDGLRAGRPTPSRAEVDPRGLEGALPHCFILERIAPGMGRFRVAGRVLAQTLGIELQGLPISIAFDVASRDALEDALERVFAGPEIVRLSVSTRVGAGGGKVDAQILFLPLRDDLGRVTRILGAVAVTDGDPAARRHAQRLTIDGVDASPIPIGEPIGRPMAIRKVRSAGTGPAEVIPLQHDPA